MIQSMTGYGSAQGVEDGISHFVEIRSVNNRYLKLSIKLPDSLQFAEIEVDKLLRSRVSRGAVTFSHRMRSDRDAGGCVINQKALQKYVSELTQVKLPAHVHATLDVGAVAALPGVCEPLELDEAARERQIKAIRELISVAFDQLMKMRREEGQALKRDLTESVEAIRTFLAAIRQRAPFVVEEYHERLKTRVAMLLKEGTIELDGDTLAREVAIYADRCDINEEVTRLTSHLDQFLETCGRKEPSGRTLDFLAQEMLREANTIGSKSYDAEIARSVVEIKGLIDRLKEQVQNVE